MSNILVTGGFGFIGREASELLEKLGHKIERYDLKCNNADIRDKYRLDTVFSTGNFDAVLHLAARAGVPMGQAYQEEYISTNITGTLNVVELCKKYNVPKIISFSSSSVLGGNFDPQKGLVESADYNPLSLYGITKVAGEQIVKTSGLNYAIIRPFSVYGEYGRPDMVIFKWIKQIKAGRPVTFYGSGNTSRGYTYVKDIAEAIPKILDLLGEYDELPHLHNLKKEYVFHLGGAEVVRLKELWGLFKDYCDKNNIAYEVEEVELPGYDIEASHADTGLAERLLEFKPRKQFKRVINRILKKELSA